jgi:hypothetical protein
MPTQLEQSASKASIAIADVATDRASTAAERRESLERLRSEINGHLSRLEDGEE